jgi:phytoene/squalene synthetase
MARFAVSEAHIAAATVGQAWQQLMQFQVQRARDMMKRGAPLGSILTGRIGLEMRLIIAGGNRILSKLEKAKYDMYRHRPVLRPHDWLIMLLNSAPFKF